MSEEVLEIAEGGITKTKRRRREKTLLEEKLGEPIQRGEVRRTHSKRRG